MIFDVTFDVELDVGFDVVDSLVIGESVASIGCKENYINFKAHFSSRHCCTENFQREKARVCAQCISIESAKNTVTVSVLILPTHICACSELIYVHDTPFPHSLTIINPLQYIRLLFSNNVE